MKYTTWATIGIGILSAIVSSGVAPAGEKGMDSVVTAPQIVSQVAAGLPGGAKATSRSTKLSPFSPVDPKMKITEPPKSNSLLGMVENLSGKALDDAAQTMIPWAEEFKAAVTEEKDRPSKRFIFGNDDRTRVANTASYPFSAVCQLELTFPKGSATGTGFFTSYRTVMTCGHCVFDDRLGGWATRIRVIPGRNGSNAPFGTAWASKMYSTSGWTVNRDHGYDFGAIVLGDSTLGNRTGHFGYSALSTTSLTNRNNQFSTAGYPGDKGSIYMFTTSGSFVSASAWNLYYYFDIKGGQSGSPIWYRESQGGRYVVGIVSAEYQDGSAPNIATRVNNDLFNWIKSLP